jgi:uroporphyrinogen decarboxylase
MTPREIVYRTLDRRGPPRAARQLWTLPWARDHYPRELAGIEGDFPPDIETAPGFHAALPATEGGQYAPGTYRDEWGCLFTNVHPGVIGQVKEPLVADEDWADVSRVHVPEELLSVDVDRVNAYCRSSDQFLIAGACPRPFEQLQFIRGTEQLYMDLAVRQRGMLSFLERMHDHYCRLLEVWARTEVDALMFMDDWGAQRGLLIDPQAWSELFKPLYRDYIDIAHRHGKRAFMHSDGDTLEIYPFLIDLGLDAFNSQIFCIGVERLRRFCGKITFWGEVDRAHLLPYGSTADIDAAVRSVKDALWDRGGCIAQCEFGAGARPDNVRQVFETWDRITARGQ